MQASNSDATVRPGVAVFKLNNKTDNDEIIKSQKSSYPFIQITFTLMLRYYFLFDGIYSIQAILNLWNHHNTNIAHVVKVCPVKCFFFLPYSNWLLNTMARMHLERR